MHHYGEDSTYVGISEHAFHIEFENKVTGSLITMRIPKIGALENPSMVMTREIAENVGHEIAHQLRTLLSR